MTIKKKKKIQYYLLGPIHEYSNLTLTSDPISISRFKSNAPQFDS